MSEVNSVSSLYKAANTYSNSQINAASSDTEAFSKALAQEMAVMQAGQAGTSSAEEASPLSSYMPFLTNAAAGQSLEAQILLFCMSLATGQADASSMLTLLTQAVAQIESDAEKEKLRRSIMDSSYDYSILDTVNEQIFQSAPEAYPYEAWKPCDPLIENTPENRSAAIYASVIDQFGVEENPRYENNKRGTGDTYCNIFTWDVTSAMNAELPHYVDLSTGEPRSYDNREGAHEMTANRTYDWLVEHGEKYGWVEVTEEEAQMLANAGLPTVTSWKNPSGSGHLQVVRPEQAGASFDPEKGVAVAQAGSKRLNYTHANDIFSDRAMQQLKYFAHY